MRNWEQSEFKLGNISCCNEQSMYGFPPGLLAQHTLRMNGFYFGFLSRYVRELIRCSASQPKSDHTQTSIQFWTFFYQQTKSDRILFNQLWSKFGTMISWPSSFFIYSIQKRCADGVKDSDKEYKKICDPSSKFNWFVTLIYTQREEMDS